MTAQLEALSNNTWNIWMLQEMRLPFYLPPFVFHDKVLHHFLSQLSFLITLLEHFDKSDVINVNQ